MSSCTSSRFGIIATFRAAMYQVKLLDIFNPNASFRNQFSLGSCVNSIHLSPFPVMNILRFLSLVKDLSYIWLFCTCLPVLFDTISVLLFQTFELHKVPDLNIPPRCGLDICDDSMPYFIFNWSALKCSNCLWVQILSRQFVDWQ